MTLATSFQTTRSVVRRVASRSISRPNALIALAFLVATACAGAETEFELPMVEIVAEDYSFQLPETVPAGRVRIQLTNRGGRAHAAQLYRLDDGVTLDRFKSAMETGIAAERAIASVVGGPANIEGGETGPAVEVTLEPGDYVVVCWLLSAGRTPHAFLGMVDGFTVVGEADEVSSPGSDGTFELSEYQIQVPKDFDGTGRFDVVNRGSEWHELVFLEIGEAQNPEEALAHLTGVEESFPPPSTSRGGTGALEVSGGTATIDLDLDPGRYLIVCAVPTAAEIYHANLGMWTEVTIP